MKNHDAHNLVSLLGTILREFASAHKVGPLFWTDFAHDAVELANSPRRPFQLILSTHGTHYVRNPLDNEAAVITHCVTHQVGWAFEVWRFDGSTISPVYGPAF